MILKSFSIFGREFFRVERDKEGNFNYNLLENKGFDNSEDYLKVSLNNPIIQTIISLRSKIISQVQITHVDSKGKEVINSDALRLLKSPNYFQSQQDFLYQLVWFMSATGTNYTYQKKNAINGQPLAIYNLISSEIDLNKTNEIDKFIATKEDIKTFEDQFIKYKLDKTTYDLKIGDIIPFYDMANGLEKHSFMKAPSRLKGISKTIQNIEENIKAKNINLKMAQKYLATNQGVANGIVPQLTDTDRKAVTNVIHSKSLQVTNVPIKVQHLVDNLKNLSLDPMYANDTLTCLLAFEMNRDVINSFADGASTYDNQTQGFINWLQNSVQTDVDSIMDSFSQEWGLFEKGEKLIGSFDHLPIMAGVVKSKLETFKIAQESFKIALENGMSVSDISKMQEALILKLKL